MLVYQRVSSFSRVELSFAWGYIIYPSRRLRTSRPAWCSTQALEMTWGWLRIWGPQWLDWYEKLTKSAAVFNFDPYSLGWTTSKQLLVRFMSFFRGFLCVLMIFHRNFLRIRFAQQLLSSSGFSPFGPWVPLRLWQDSPSMPTPWSIELRGFTTQRAGGLLHWVLSRLAACDLDMTGGSPFSNGVWGCCNTAWPSHGLCGSCVRGMDLSGESRPARHLWSAGRDETPWEIWEVKHHTIPEGLGEAQSLWLPERGFQTVSDSFRSKKLDDGILHFNKYIYLYVYIYVLLYMVTRYQTRKRQWFPAGFSVVARRCCYPPPSFVTPSVASCAPACWVPRACGALAWQGPWRWGDPSPVAHCWGRPPKVGLEFCVGIWIAWLLKLSKRGVVAGIVEEPYDCWISICDLT